MPRVAICLPESMLTEQCPQSFMRNAYCLSESTMPPPWICPFPEHPSNLEGMTILSEPRDMFKKYFEQLVGYVHRVSRLHEAIHQPTTMTNVGL